MTPYMDPAYKDVEGFLKKDPFLKQLQDYIDQSTWKGCAGTCEGGRRSGHSATGLSGEVAQLRPQPQTFLTVSLTLQTLLI